MAKLTQDRDTKRRAGDQFCFEAGGQIFCGAMVAMNASGKLVASTADGGIVVGVAQEAGNTGDMIPVMRGVFSFAGDGFTLTDIGSQCVVVDDQTVGKAGATAQNGASASSAAIAGTVLDVDAEGVWVSI